MKSLSSIHNLQKKALRIISKSKYLAHHIPICHSLQLLNLPDLYNLKALTFFYDYYHGKLPPFFNNKLSFQLSRNNEMILKTQYRRTDIAAMFLFNTLPSIWNPLPTDIKSQINKSKNTFVSKVKSFLINKYENWECTDDNCYACMQ